MHMTGLIQTPINDIQNEKKPQTFRSSCTSVPLEMLWGSWDISAWLAAPAKVLWEVCVLLDQQREARWDPQGISDVPKHPCFGT